MERAESEISGRETRGRRGKAVELRTMKATDDRLEGDRKPATLTDYIEQARYIVYGAILAESGEGRTDEYRLEIVRILSGELDPCQPVAVDPDCLRRTVRFGLSSRREVVAFSLRGGATLSGDDLILPVILDPLNNEKYVKIPPELAGKDSLRESLARKWSTRRNPSPKPAMCYDVPFVPFEEFTADLSGLCRDLR